MARSQQERRGNDLAEVGEKANISVQRGDARDDRRIANALDFEKRQRIVADLVTPTAGEVLVNGKPAERARLDHDDGMVFQSPVLFDWRTVEENVTLPHLRSKGKPWWMGRRWRNEEVKAVLEEYDVRPPDAGAMAAFRRWASSPLLPGSSPGLPASVRLSQPGVSP